MSESTDKLSFVINVRSYGGAYYARGGGKTASSTARRIEAVERCAIKLKLGHTKISRSVTVAALGITLKELTSGTYIAEWTPTPIKL